MKSSFSTIPQKKEEAKQLTPAPRPAELGGQIIEGEVVQAEKEKAIFTAPKQFDDSPKTTHELARRPASKVGQIIGELEASDYGLPKLKLLGTNSNMVIERPKDYAPGDWVLGDTIIWRDGTDPVEITLLVIEKKFQQETKYGEDMGQIFNTAEEAIAAGLIRFGGDDVGFKPMGFVTMLIKQNVDSELFTEEFNGELYAVATWRIAGTSYPTVMNKVAWQMRSGRLQEGMHTASFKLSARLEKGKVKPYWTPVLTDGDEHSAEFIAFAEFCGSGNEAEA